MKLDYGNLPIGGIAKLTRTHKGIEFMVFIEEEVNDYEYQQCHTVFRTPKGKYKLDWNASKELIDSVSEEDFMEMACENAWHNYNTRHGWT